MKASEAIDAVEIMCGGDDGFHRAWRFIGDEWDQNLEDFCLQRQTPEKYVERAKMMYQAYQEHLFNLNFEKRLVNSREGK